MNSATSLSRSSGCRTCGVGAQSGEQLVADVTVHAHHLPYIHTYIHDAQKEKKGQRRNRCHDVIAFHSLYNSNTLAPPHTHSHTNKTNTQRHTASKQSQSQPPSPSPWRVCARCACVPRGQASRTPPCGPADLRAGHVNSIGHDRATTTTTPRAILMRNGK